MEIKHSKQQEKVPEVTDVQGVLVCLCGFTQCVSMLALPVCHGADAASSEQKIQTKKVQLPSHLLPPFKTFSAAEADRLSLIEMHDATLTLSLPINSVSLTSPLISADGYKYK